MITVNSSNINSTVNPNLLLGTKFKPVDMLNKNVDLESLDKLLKDKGLEDIARLLEKIKKLSSSSSQDVRKVKELVEKLKKITDRFGLRMELALTKEGDTLVRIYNKLDNRQLTTIPLHILLKMLVGKGHGNSAVKANNGEEFPELMADAADTVKEKINGQISIADILA